MFRYRYSVIVVVLLLLAAMPGNGPAQVSTASVNGTVRDAAGSVVPGAEIALRNLATGIERRTLSNTVGNYVFVSIPSGTYTIEAGAAGFARRKIESFTLEVNQTATFDFALQLGTVEQSVTVRAEGAAVQASTSELGEVIGSRRIADLPLNGRNYTQLLALTPGVSPISVSQNATYFRHSVGGLVLPSVNGQNNRCNLFLLDGINNLGAYWGNYAVGPIVDTIEEFKVQSHNDEAQFGGVLGGVINVVTKSGTNQPHGSLWEFVRNTAFDARNFFLPSVTPFKQNQFGVSAGGPVTLPKLYRGRDRTFFMLGYQGFRFRSLSNVYSLVPTPANLRGDLSDISRQVYDPFTTQAASPGGSRLVRQPFPGNQIPASRIHQGILAWAKALIPAPMVITQVQNRNTLNTDPLLKNQEEYTARIDHTLRTTDFLWFRYSGVLHDQQAGANLNTGLNITEVRAKNIGLTWVHTFGPSSVLEVQFGRTRETENVPGIYKNVSPDLWKETGFAESFARNWVGGSTLQPGFNVSGYFALAANDYWGRPSNIWQWRAGVSKVHGSHIVKFGGEFTRNDVRILQHVAYSQFDTPQTADPARPGTTGNAVASFLLNVPYTAYWRNLVASSRWGGETGMYLHDQWKITSRLTLNIGLRYDRTFYPPYGTQKDGNLYSGTMDLIRGVYVLQAVPPPCSVTKAAPCIPTADGSLPEHVIVDPRGKLLHDSTDNWQPRVGLAYRLTSRTALRASFGRFFENWGGVSQLSSNVQGTWPSVTANVNPPLNVASLQQPTPTVTGTNPFPGAMLPAATPFQTGAWYFDPYIENPYALEWNLGIQHQFTTDLNLVANYVGSGSRRLDIGTRYNVARTPGPGDARARFPFPYMDPNYFDRSWGRSSYHGLQLQMQKKYSSGLAYTVSYTWSKAIDLGCSGWYGAEGCAVQDPYNLSGDRGPAGFDLTHILAISWAYDLPFGPRMPLRSANRVVDHIIGNWQFNGITTLQSGQPYNLTIRSDIANTLNLAGYMRPNVVGDYRIADPSPTRWFNQEAFALPPLYTFGNLGRNRLRADWTRNFDLSLFRRFPLGESKEVQLRVESFNTFNTPMFAAPNSEYTYANFGAVSATRVSPRQLQFGLKIVF